MAKKTEVEKYFDKNGVEVKRGMFLQHDDGEVNRVYETVDGDLGFNASNENWIGFNELNRQLYPLYQFDMSEWRVVEGK